MNNKNYIVGIGASAGGLEALQKLLSDLPSNTGFPYIIVQHLSPDYKSLLGEILSKYTSMPVIQAENGMKIKPDCVYVIQPGKNMRIADEKLLLSPQKEKQLNFPIDMFFHSLAKEAGSRAIAVILSGTGSDGTNGIKKIKESDGMILVQNYESSKFDGMPRSAMNTSLVDAQISPEEIASEIRHIAFSANTAAMPSEIEESLDDTLMKKIFFILKKTCNVNFTYYKQATIVRRIERRMIFTHKEHLSEYVDFLYDSPEEARMLTKELLIGITNFFRDPGYFQCLKEDVIQDLIVRSKPEEPIRVWVAGCSTGEEAYSIAILFSEVMETLRIRRTVKIFATDLDSEAISFASAGVYVNNISDTVSTDRLTRFFTRHNNTYAVNRDIRNMIVFSQHNVFEDPPFSNLDLISCRNLLIYLQPILQGDLFAIFHSILKDKGYLFLGKSESASLYANAFVIEDAEAKIFSHCRSAEIPNGKVIPHFQQETLGSDAKSDEKRYLPRKIIPEELRPEKQAAINNILLEQFLPACLVVNEKNELVHTYGENKNYIHFAVGSFSNSLFDVITEELKIPVSTLLKESRDKNKTAQYKNIRFTGEREEGVINLTALPLKNKQSPANGFYALIFSQTEQRGAINDAIPYNIDNAASQRISDLEQTLTTAQSELARSVTEQECVNEELQSANEELLTANEELQSSNEELQSINEELYTVNSEYQLKLTELASLNDDIANFLSSTLIGIIFVDNKLSIRKYTDYVSSEFNVMEHDIGRSLRFISHYFPSTDLPEICENVLNTLMADEREITTIKNKTLFMRVAPYRTTENKILGCVITLVDTTAQKQGQMQLQSVERELSLVQQSNDEKSDYVFRLLDGIQESVGALIALSKEAKKQVSDDAALISSLDKITDKIEYMAAIANDPPPNNR